jgi:hypothetical protein
MKLLNIFESEEINNEKVMVSLDSEKFNGFIRANNTASYIIDCLKNDVSEKEIIIKMVNKYGITEERATQAVSSLLNQLRELGLIIE